MKASKKERKDERKNNRKKRLKGSITFRVTGRVLNRGPEVMRPFFDVVYIGSLFCKFGKRLDKCHS